MANMPLHPDVDTIDLTVAEFNGRTSVRIGAHFLPEDADSAIPGQRAFALHIDTKAERAVVIEVWRDLTAKLQAALNATPVKAESVKPQSTGRRYTAQRNSKPVTVSAESAAKRPAPSRSGRSVDELLASI